MKRFTGAGLEGELQRELHDSRVGRSVDLAKDVVIKRSVWISLSQAVRHIERLGAKLQSLTFARLEDS